MKPIGIKTRTAFAVIISYMLILFGVFLFSGSHYQGIMLREDIFMNMFGGSWNDAWDAIYELLGSSLKADFFYEMSYGFINGLNFFQILTGHVLLPAILTWFLAGINIGAWIQNLKKTYITAGILYGIHLIIWFIIGIFANADVGSYFTEHILSLLGEMFTCVIPNAIGLLVSALLSRKIKEFPE